jgi:hypothetical protein
MLFIGDRNLLPVKILLTAETYLLRSYFIKANGRIELHGGERKNPFNGCIFQVITRIDNISETFDSLEGHRQYTGDSNVFAHHHD